MTELEPPPIPPGNSASAVPPSAVPPSAPPPPAPPAPRNAGLSLVAAFRAARIQQRPALQTGLRASRHGLRKERLERLGKSGPASPAKAADAPVSAVGAPAQPREDTSPDTAAGQESRSSVFARFMDGAQSEASTASAQAAPAAAQQEQASSEGTEAAPPLSAPPPSAPPPPAPKLSEIGFGPGMVIRFRQLGIETAADLAAADAESLRTALGDITRLINVDIWIASAQKACSAAA